VNEEESPPRAAKRFLKDKAETYLGMCHPCARESKAGPLSLGSSLVTARLLFLYPLQNF